MDSRDIRDEKALEQIRKVEDRLKERALGINNIPPPYKKEFQKIAKEEYANDYGVAIKELVRHYQNYYPKGNEEVEAKIEILAEEISALKQEVSLLKQEPEGDYVLSADGSKKIKKSRG